MSKCSSLLMNGPSTYESSKRSPGVHDSLSTVTPHHWYLMSEMVDDSVVMGDSDMMDDSVAVGWWAIMRLLAFGERQRYCITMMTSILTNQKHHFAHKD